MAGPGPYLVLGVCSLPLLLAAAFLSGGLPYLIAALALMVLLVGILGIGGGRSAKSGPLWNAFRLLLDLAFFGVALLAGCAGVILLIRSDGTYKATIPELVGYTAVVAMLFVTSIERSGPRK